MTRRSQIFVWAIGLASGILTHAISARELVADFTSDRISVVTRGKGPDIILIPGLASHRDAWSSAAALLEDRYTLHLVQVNGFAGFPAGANADGPVSPPVAAEIARYIRDSRLVRPAVIGHSMGGTIAMMLAARHPDAVGRIMVVDGSPFMGAMFGPPGTTAESVQPMADQMRTQVLAEPLSAPTNPISKLFPTMTRTEAMRPVILRQAMDSDQRTVANAFHEVIVTDLRPELGRITAPVTVLYAVPQGMPVTPEQFDGMMRMLYSNVAGARFVRIDESGHFIQIDQ